MNFGPRVQARRLPGLPGGGCAGPTGYQRPQGGERAVRRKPLIPKGPCADGAPEARINVNRPAVFSGFAAGSPVGRRVAIEGTRGAGVRSRKGVAGNRPKGVLV